jgi:uncharacterized protein YndB with AHSA1/START domain
MTAHHRPDPDEDRDLVLTRVFDVPASLLFQAFSRPEHLLRWFGPEPYPLATAEVDFRIGGRYRFAMRDPSGAVMTPFGGQYLEIVQDRRIVYSNAFEQAEAPAMVVTVTFDEADGRTTLTHATRFASAAHKQEYVGMGIVEGLSLSFDQLGALCRGLG